MVTPLEERLRNALTAEASRAPLANPEWRGQLVSGHEPPRPTPLRRLAVVGAAAAVVLIGAVGAAALTQGDGGGDTSSVADEPPVTESTVTDSTAGDSTEGNQAGAVVSGGGLSVVSCSSSGDDTRTDGDGDIQTEQRSIAGFETIEVSGCASVVVRKGAPSVAVTADANLLAQVTTEVDGSQLKIGVRGSFTSGATPKVVVTTDRLDELAIVGASDASVEALTGDRFDLRVGGAGDVTVTGTVGKVDVEVQGSADADLSGLEATDASVSVSGTGSVEVRASGKVKASVSGTGEVIVHGAAEVDADVDGVGEVRRSDGTVVAEGPIDGRRSRSTTTTSSETPQKGAVPPGGTPGGGASPSDVEEDVERRIDEVTDAIDAYTDCIDEQLDAGNFDRLAATCEPLLPR